MQTLNPVIEIEEPIYSYTEAKNGAGPFWCRGNSCVARYGDDVFVSGLETLENVKPLHNVRWLLFKREENGWVLQLANEERQREPCPLSVFSDGRLILSVNPTLTEPDTYEGPANPHLLQFQAKDLSVPPVAVQPEWDHNPGFGEHSYRGIGVDGVNHEIALFNNYGYDEQYWAFLNREGEWINRGIIHYPERCCYQNIALTNGICHIQAVTDIMEPNPKWRAWKKDYPKWPDWKKALHQRGWDYVFRKLYYYYHSDISHGQFGEPLEIDNVDATAGFFRNLDLWIAPDGAAHLLYLKKNVDTPEMRDAFFPGLPLRTSLEYCIIAKNQVIQRRTLLSGGENLSNELPIEACLHESADGRLFLIYATENSVDKNCVENYIAEIADGEFVSAPFKLPMQKPLTFFMAANKRNGCAPSDWIDLYGSSLQHGAIKKPPVPESLRYARVRLR
jgi:hypothetical protein